MELTIYASLAEHLNDGFLWLRRPGFPARSIVKITNLQTRQWVYCEALQIEDNFLER